MSAVAVADPVEVHRAAVQRFEDHKVEAAQRADALRRAQAELYQANADYSEARIGVRVAGKTSSPQLEQAGAKIAELQRTIDALTIDVSSDDEVSRRLQVREHDTRGAAADSEGRRLLEKSKSRYCDLVCGVSMLADAVGEINFYAEQAEQSGCRGFVIGVGQRVNESLVHLASWLDREIESGDLAKRAPDLIVDIRPLPRAFPLGYRVRRK